MPRRIILLAIFALLTLAAPAHAADSPAWTAWLHYGRHMTLIDSDGHTLRELDLPLPEGYDDSVFIRRREVGISRNGQWATYELDQPEQLQVVDLTTNQLSMSFSLDSGGYWMSPTTAHIFDTSGRSLAVAYVGYQTASDIHIRILDTQTGTIYYSLNTTISDLGLASDLTMLTPIIQNYSNGQVEFTLSLYDPDGREGNLLGPTDKFLMQSFVWNMLTGNVHSDNVFPGYQADIFPATAEIIAAAANPLFPMQINDDDDPVENTLQVYDPTFGAVFPFYRAKIFFPGKTFFVQNGSRILTYALQEKNEDLKWTLLERDGTIVDEWLLPENLQIDAVKNTPDGFIYTAALKKTDEWNWEQPLPAIYEVNTRDDKLDTGRLIWQLPLKTFHTYFGNSLSYFDIAWVHSDAPIGPFKPWAQLADPVYAPTPETSQATITPTTIPMPSPLFHVGQTVRVQTIDGEILNLRAAPTRKSDILVYIEDDTQLELLEGPVEAEGFHWWRVHTPDGLEGWVVENDGELQTILPE